MAVSLSIGMRIVRVWNEQPASARGTIAAMNWKPGLLVVAALLSACGNEPAPGPDAETAAAAEAQPESENEAKEAAQ